MGDLREFVGNQDDKATWLTTKVVAQQFGVDPITIRRHKQNHPELIDGVHWMNAMMNIEGANRKVLLWSKLGINKLAQIIRTDEAKEHRELTTIDPDRIMKGIELILRKELSAIPRIEERVISLESNLTSPVEYSKLQKRFSDLRYKLFKLGVPWLEVHAIAKGWTGLAKYDHMNIGQVQEGIRKVENEIQRRQKNE